MDVFVMLFDGSRYFGRRLQENHPLYSKDKSSLSNIKQHSITVGLTFPVLLVWGLSVANHYHFMNYYYLLCSSSSMPNDDDALSALHDLPLPSLHRSMVQRKHTHWYTLIRTHIYEIAVQIIYYVIENRICKCIPRLPFLSPAVTLDETSTPLRVVSQLRILRISFDLLTVPISFFAVNYRRVCV